MPTNSLFLSNSSSLHRCVIEITLVQFSAPMPAQYKNKTKGPKPRGVSNRNRGLKWVRENAETGVAYFADDDNTYDLELFHEVSSTNYF